MNPVLILPALHMTFAAALIIGTGIDARQGVFLQEFHQGDRVKYLLANTSAKPVRLTVVKFDSKWRLGQPIGKILAGPWEIPAKANLEIDVSDLAGDDLLRFFDATNNPLGVLHAPRKPTSDVGAKTRWAAGGLNGMGNYIDGMSVALPATAVKAGDEVVVRLRLLDAARGSLKFSPPQEPNPAVGPQLHPIKVVSATLPVKKDGEAWLVDFAKPEKPGEHWVELTFQVPADHKDPIFTFTGWYAMGSGGGNTLIRAVEVSP